MASENNAHYLGTPRKKSPALTLKASVTAFILALLIVFSVNQTEAQTQCPQHYYNGMAPQITNASMLPKSREICYAAFAVQHSGISKTPLWSAEHLTKENIESARKLDRVSNFHAETRLPADERAELSDYSRSGYDRGHLTPNGDMPDRTAQQDSHSLANIIPQDPQCNRNIFERTESAVRQLATTTGSLYVITGPLFIGNDIQQLNGRVLIPTHIYKILYDPHSRRAGAYLFRNQPGNEYETITVDKLEKMAGVNFFPKISQSEKQKMLQLPKPLARGANSNYGKRNTHTRGLPKWFLH